MVDFVNDEGSDKDRIADCKSLKIMRCLNQKIFPDKILQVAIGNI